MTTIQKIKKTILIALGFGLATYLLMSGFAILNKEVDAPGKIHGDAVKGTPLAN